jgi:prophage antirepressor-like protein
MDKDDLIVFFEDIPVRKIKINNEWWVSAVDTAKAIGYSNPQRESNKIISKNAERFEGYTTRTLVDQVEGGIKKKRNITLLNLSGVIAMCMLSELPKAIPFQRWADSVLERHIKERVERKKIYGEITDESIGARNMETSQWLRHGAKGKDFGNLTKKEYNIVFGKKEIRKKEMNGEELLILLISNATNALHLMQKKDPIGLNGIETQLYQTGKLIKGIERKVIK